MQKIISYLFLTLLLVTTGSIPMRAEEALPQKPSTRLWKISWAKPNPATT